MTVGEKVIWFNQNLGFSGTLPHGVQVMNPFRDNSYAMLVSKQFYTRFYNDNNPRTLLLGINPGRFGAGSTGIPFTDTIRLNEKCGIPFHYFRTYEPSSAFMYEMIEAYGGLHPRYIMQYKSKSKKTYIEKYTSVLHAI